MCYDYYYYSRRVGAAIFGGNTAGSSGGGGIVTGTSHMRGAVATYVPSSHDFRYRDINTPFDEPMRMRFFVIKSLTYENLVVSVRKGLWATHRNHERILNEAYIQDQ